MNERIVDRSLCDHREKEEGAFGKCAEKSKKIRQEGNNIFSNNKVHNNEVHKQILLLYNKCIAVAPKDSEALSFGYGNRSAFWLHLKEFDKCLVDIDKANQITHSDEFKKKLFDRKLKCLSMQKIAGEEYKVTSKVEDIEASKPYYQEIEELREYFKHCDQEKLNNLNLPPRKDINHKLDLPKLSNNKHYSCAANSVTIGYNEKFGRHLIATRNIKPGEIVMIEEGYTLMPFKSKTYLLCSHCLDFAYNAIPCEFCVFAIYCSKNCKDIAWEKYHDIECSALEYMSKAKFEICDRTNIKATVRLFITAVKSEGLENIFDVAKEIDNKEGEIIFYAIKCKLL